MAKLGMAVIMKMRWLGDNAVDVADLLPDHNFHHKDGVLIIHQHGGDVRIPKGGRFAVDDAGHAHKVLMLTRQFTLKPNGTVTACPRCSNVSALESASVFPKISSSHLKSITSSLDFHYDHSRTC